MMKKILMLFILGATPLCATLYEDCCCPSGNWCVSAEALYWKPCIEGYQYAQIAPTTGDSRVYPQKVVKPNYDWGFKILAGFLDCQRCNWIGLDWTYFRSTDAITISPENLQVYQGGDSTTADRATARLKTRYNRVNLRLGRMIAQSCECNSYAYAYSGIRYVDLEAKRRLNATLVSQSQVVEREKSEFNGLGFEVGFGGIYELACGFSFLANVGTVANIGEKKYQYSITTISTSTTRIDLVPYPTQWGCIPAVELRLGFNYTYNCDCWSLIAEIGYEMSYYFHAIKLRKPNTNPIGGGLARTTNLGFGGPFVGLAFCF